MTAAQAAAETCPSWCVEHWVQDDEGLVTHFGESGHLGEGVEAHLERFVDTVGGESRDTVRIATETEDEALRIPLAQVEPLAGALRALAGVPRGDAISAAALKGLRS